MEERDLFAMEERDVFAMEERDVFASLVVLPYLPKALGLSVVVGGRSTRADPWQAGYSFSSFIKPCRNCYVSAGSTPVSAPPLSAVWE